VAPQAAQPAMAPMASPKHNPDNFLSPDAMHKGRGMKGR
jgi:hypothetical protein